MLKVTSVSNKIKFSYAPSIGVAELNDKEKDIIRKNLSSFYIKTW